MSNLEQRMKDAGMIPLEQMLEGTPLDRWKVHTGVNGIDGFARYAAMRFQEYDGMYQRKYRDTISEEDAEQAEMREWVTAFRSTWGEVLSIGLDDIDGLLAHAEAKYEKHLRVFAEMQLDRRDAGIKPNDASSGDPDADEAYWKALGDQGHRAATKLLPSLGIGGSSSYKRNAGPRKFASPRIRIRIGKRRACRECLLRRHDQALQFGRSKGFASSESERPGVSLEETQKAENIRQYPRR